MKRDNTSKSSERGASPERDNRPLSDVAPEDSAALRGHGAHGRRGHTVEDRIDPAATEPDGTSATDRGLGSGNWGNAASGGSTFDKRSPNRED
jgi:hypothetical protein